MKPFSKDEKEYYIIYFDILGYKQYFEENDDHREWLEYIIGVIYDLRIGTEAYNNIYSNLLERNVKIKAFSDNVVICVEADKIEVKNYLLLGGLIADIQADIFIKYGLLVRGAFTKGKFFINKDIVFGEALIKAVVMECNAKYPRIVVDEEKLNKSEWSALGGDDILQDKDGKYYLNYFNKIMVREKLYKIKDRIKEKIKKDGKYNPTVKDENKIKVYESIIQKTLWVVEKFNEACDAIGKAEEKIDYKVTINKRLLKMELSLAEKA